MNYQWFVGIDVSKSTLDISILEGSESKGHFQISNTEKEIKLFLRKLAKHERINLNETVFPSQQRLPYLAQVSRMSQA